ncbi:hypothetical protein RIR_jg17054.t1 [Rhizophagus irregularis DAOM 181602=DAOM 197198]|nr:hypothetical protein RIR_jg17054.t1 [Rhizophagus irregularis DAOM 181602=DAOM 197198]
MPRNLSLSNKDVWRSIILVIKKWKHLYYNTSSNKFLEYEAEGNAVKMNRSDSKFFHLGEGSLAGNNLLHSLCG